MPYANYNYYARYSDFRNNFNDTTSMEQEFIPRSALIGKLLFLNLPLHYRNLPNNINLSQINVRSSVTLSSALIDFILDIDNSGSYTKSIEYELSESTFKAAYSTFIGTVVAAYIAMIRYKVQRPYHIINNQHFTFSINTQTANTQTVKPKSRPDLFGISNNNIGYIFEAKGTTSSEYGVIHSRVKTGRTQKNNISKVEDQSSGTIYEDNTLKKRVVVTSFNESNKLCIHDIDPDPEIDIFYNEDIAIFDYYKIIYYLLKNNMPGNIIYEVENHNFIFTSIGDYRIGLLHSIYKLIENHNEQYMKLFKSKLEINSKELKGLFMSIQTKTEEFNEENQTIKKMKEIEDNSKPSYLLNGVVTYEKKYENKLIDKNYLIL